MPGVARQIAGRCGETGGGGWSLTWVQVLAPGPCRLVHSHNLEASVHVQLHLSAGAGPVPAQSRNCRDAPISCCRAQGSTVSSALTVSRLLCRWELLSCCSALKTETKSGRELSKGTGL